MTTDIDAIRQRAQAATPGPWRWYGNTDVQRIYLSTVRWGRQLVMGFERWGMQSAQPSFVDGRTWKPDPDSDYDFGVSGWVKPVRDLARYEVAPNATDRKDPNVYRADIGGVRNPDAEFIAHARQDVDDLLAKVDELTAENLRLREQVFAQKPVIEAAEAWGEAWEGLKGDDTVPYAVAQPSAALHDAVESYRLMDLALTSARTEAGAAR